MVQLLIQRRWEGEDFDDFQVMRYPRPAWYGMVWYCMIWCGVIWDVMVGYGW